MTKPAISYAITHVSACGAYRTQRLDSLKDHQRMCVECRLRILADSAQGLAQQLEETLHLVIGLQLQVHDLKEKLGKAVQDDAET